MRRIYRIVLSSALAALLTLGFLAPTSAEAASKRVSAGSVKITGTAKVGLTLTAKTGSWKPSGVKLKYQWYRSGKKIGGATKVTYTLGSSDLNKTITVKVSGSKAGYKAASKTSGKTKKVGLGTISYAGVTISGKIAVGGTVRFAGAWKPADAKVTYQWWRGEAKIKGATKRTYVVGAQDEGQHLGVEVRVSRSGYKTRDLYWELNNEIRPRGSMDGELEVGTDIQPGTYVAEGGTECYWAREDARFTRIGEGPNSDGQIIVTIKPGDRYYFSVNCGAIRVFNPSTVTQMTSFGEGQFSVGPEIKPGTYQTTALSADKCYWQTNSGFDGSRDDFVADGRSETAPVTVTIGADLVGFESRGCGTWVRISD